MFIEAAGVIVLDRGGAVVAGRSPVEDGATPDTGPPGYQPIGYDDPLLAVRWACGRTPVTRYDSTRIRDYAESARRASARRLASSAATLVIPLLYHGDCPRSDCASAARSPGTSTAATTSSCLTTMADQAAVAVANAMTHEEVVRYAEELATSLRRIQILESIKSNLSKFVPTTVQTLIEQSPEAPLLEKREADVSVLFADITGYTRLSAEMELHEVNRLVERYFGAFLDEIILCGGEVNETVGDGLMVIFQNPDPRRHAAAAIRPRWPSSGGAREINDELKGHSEPIVMHVGVNSGIASVGATKIEGLAGARWTYTASGSTTNVAARLAALSEGGDVVLSDETRRRIGDDFSAEDLGLRTLKNVPQAMRVYRIDADVHPANVARPGA